MKRFGHEVRHPHKSATRWLLVEVMTHVALRGLSHVAQTKRKHHVSLSAQSSWGKLFSPGELHHHISEREEGEMPILMGQLGTQEGSELTLHPCKVEVEELAAAGMRSPEPRSCRLPRASARESRSVVRVGGVGATCGSSSPSTMIAKSRLPKRTRTPGTQTPALLAIRSLEVKK